MRFSSFLTNPGEGSASPSPSQITRAHPAFIPTRTLVKASLESREHPPCDPLGGRVGGGLFTPGGPGGKTLCRCVDSRVHRREGPDQHGGGWVVVLHDEGHRSDLRAATKGSLAARSRVFLTRIGIIGALVGTYTRPRTLFRICAAHGHHIILATPPPIRNRM